MNPDPRREAHARRQAAGDATFALRMLAIVAIAFGVFTATAVVAALLSPEHLRAALTAAPWLGPFNLAMGLVYILAGVGLWRLKRWGVGLTLVVAAVTLGAAGALAQRWLATPGDDPRPLAGMGLRALAWVAFALLARQSARRIAAAHRAVPPAPPVPPAVPPPAPPSDPPAAP
ncbi:MAG: hypothetical protein HY423_00810 [Candidatus Lambdaproteobacteria bacterium]|nr:hypothetical protein [Candidatus Lambdaproteobacteria bacterium]